MTYSFFMLKVFPRVKDGNELTKPHLLKHNPNKKKYFDYYRGSHNAKCILIDSATKFKIPAALNDLYNGMRAPQSFKYIDQTTWNKVRAKATGKTSSPAI